VTPNWLVNYVYRPGVESLDRRKGNFAKELIMARLVESQCNDCDEYNTSEPANPGISVGEELCCMCSVCGYETNQTVTELDPE
jgi:hypothetical protein